MKYFLHDTNSFNDEKVTELFIEHGYKGLGLFYTTLEKIAFQEKPIKTVVLKKQLGIKGKDWPTVGQRYSNLNSFQCQTMSVLTPSCYKTQTNILQKKEKNKEKEVADF